MGPRHHYPIQSLYSFCPTPLFSYLRGIMQLFGLVSVWWVHEGHGDILKLAT